MYVPLQVNKSPKIVLLILLYKYFKSYCGYFDFPESDPLHKIMRYLVGFFISVQHAGVVDIFCTTVVPVLKGHLGGASP